jgi:hypothetical protein
VNRPSDDRRLWGAIVVPLLGGLTLGFLVVYGLVSKWGAEQWGPVAAWVAGALTLFAVVVALRQANIARRESGDLHFARLVDHEVSRRRDCIEAVSDLWAALAGIVIEFSAFTDYLINLPQDWQGSVPRTDGVPPERPGEPFIYEVGRRFQTFYNGWAGVVQPPLFVALAILHGTEMYDEVEAINDGIVKMSNEDTEGGFIAIREEIFADALQGIGHRPATARLTAMWQDIVGRRYEHLRLVQQHFDLTRKVVERYVLENQVR